MGISLIVEFLRGGETHAHVTTWQIYVMTLTNTCNNFVKSMLQLCDNFDLVCKTLVTKWVCDKARQWSDMDTIEKS